jgi:hypothetical protein
MIAFPPSGFESLNRLDGLGYDLGFDRFRGRMLKNRVARFELEALRLPIPRWSAFVDVSSESEKLGTTPGIFMPGLIELSGMTMSVPSASPLHRT